MYKILLSYGSTTKNLWKPYMVEKTETVEPEVNDEEPSTTTSIVEYETNDETELKSTIIELLKTVPSNQIRVIEDKTYTIDLLF